MVQRQGKFFGFINQIRECEIVLDEILTLFKECILLVKGAKMSLKARWKDNKVANTAVKNAMIRLIADRV
jgi:hypothetical protein